MNQNSKDEAREHRTEPKKQKRLYHPPILTRFGDIRTKTLSPTVILETESGKVGNYSDRV